MDEQNEQLWQAVLGELELTLSRASFTTWLKNTFIIENLDGKIIVGVPNTFSQAWLKSKYHNDIYRILQNKSKERIREIIYKVQNLKNYSQQQDQIKKNIVNEIQSAPPEVNHQRQYAESTGINPRYTFEAYIVGKANELAHAAAMAVAATPGRAYNPLFIYGGVGLGKTHLMQAIGNQALQQEKAKKVLYVTCEQFTNDYINSISSGKMDKFTYTYRSPDILLIDDIQFLTGKEGTQEAFFHTFNDLYQRDKQVVITSDRPPKAISTLQDRLLSRFESGMIADISQPDLETRMAIMRCKCTEKNFPLDEATIQTIALNISNNIRELEGALNKIIAYYQLNRLAPTAENVKNIIFSVSSAGKMSNAVSARQLIDVVSAFYDVAKDDLLGKCREKKMAFPRQIIMYLMREELNCSYPMIGEELGGRDHTTAIHAFEKIAALVTRDEKLRQEINLIKQRVYAG